MFCLEGGLPVYLHKQTLERIFSKIQNMPEKRNKKNICRYAHTNIVAKDWKKLAGFYTDVFGCVPVPPERDLSGEWLEKGTGVKDAKIKGIHLRLPGHGNKGPTLEIFQYEQNERHPVTEINREGLAHLSFEVENVEAVRDLVLSCGGKAIGELITKEIQNTGRITFIYMTDPEGNIIEIQHWDKQKPG